MNSGSPVQLVSNRYGKSRVRLMKLVRHPDHHDLFDWTVQILLTGDFDAVHLLGDNTNVLPTDTLKNTVYSRARESTSTQIEHFALELAAVLLERNPQVHSAEITIESALWKRIRIGTEPHPTTFIHGSEELQTTVVQNQRVPGKNARVTITSGLDRLLILKTAHSAFEGYLKDSLTTLPETSDRLLGTSVTAHWSYTTADEATDFARLRETVRETMLRTFAEHDSKSVQHTLYSMAEAALRAAPEIEQIDLLMPNKHSLLVDLSRFGQDNPNQIFVPTDEPHGTIQATLRRPA